MLYIGNLLNQRNVLHGARHVLRDLSVFLLLIQALVLDILQRQFRKYPQSAQSGA